ncbi:unnamed protein product [Trifolium pratense]|uniref:Uncharacterized protein n=1 Tax=Trifolium pratense TaxID=57577 RepID=A0ACB0JNR0_TRIPR|nr:unnamed protein product [Trifolium pratense]
MRSVGIFEVGALMQNYAENSDYGFIAFQLQIMRFGELWKCRCYCSNFFSDKQVDRDIMVCKHGVQIHGLC